MRSRGTDSGQKLPENTQSHTSAEIKVHSFIIKVWLVEGVNLDGGVTWYGHITHVPGGEQRYLRDLSEIEIFIQPYLQAMGLRFTFRDRLKRWLRR